MAIKKIILLLALCVFTIPGTLIANEDDDALGLLEEGTPYINKDPCCDLSDTCWTRQKFDLGCTLCTPSTFMAFLMGALIYNRDHAEPSRPLCDDFCEMHHNQTGYYAHRFNSTENSLTYMPCDNTTSSAEPIDFPASLNTRSHLYNKTLICDMLSDETLSAIADEMPELVDEDNIEE